MTKGSARTLIRRRLNERLVADGWTDIILNDLVREGLKFVQKWVLKIDPFAFMEIAYVDTIAGSGGEFYLAPDGMWYEMEVGFKATSGGGYTRLKRGGYETIRESGTDAVVRYARRGRYFAIWPNPAEAVTAGLRVQYMPTLTTGSDADSDNDNIALPVHPALHMAVVVRATMYALGETMEQRTSLGEELREELSDIDQWYHRGGDPQQVRLAQYKDA